MEPGHPFETEQTDEVRSRQRRLLRSIDTWLLRQAAAARPPLELGDELDQGMLELGVRELIDQELADSDEMRALLETRGQFNKLNGLAAVLRNRSFVESGTYLEELADSAAAKAGEIAGRPLCRSGLVWVDADEVHWDVLAAEAHSTKASKEMLDRFVRLADASPARIQLFAQRWGVLGLDRRTYLEPGAPTTGRDRVGLWHAVANDARALLRIGSRLVLGEQIDPDWWLQLRHVCRAQTASRFGDAVRIDGIGVPYLGPPGEAFARILTAWLDLAGIRPVLDWRTRPALELSPGGLYGAIGLQLAYVCSREGGFVVCSNCQTPFQPPRRPRPGSRSYCDRCRRTGAPQRDAKRDWRKRQREAEGGGSNNRRES